LYRELCLSCLRPKESCLCPTSPPMRLRTKIVLLMHPKEWRRERCGTGRLTCLHLDEAEIIPGVAFDLHPRVRELIDDPANFPVLLYPGKDSVNLSLAGSGRALAAAAAGRRMTAFFVDATWACSKAVLRESPGLLRLPRLMFEPATPSRWLIKTQPGPLCLSTLETVHELLCALEAAGLEAYPDKTRLLSAFAAMQDYQIRRAVANAYPRYEYKRQFPSVQTERDEDLARGERDPSLDDGSGGEAASEEEAGPKPDSRRPLPRGEVQEAEDPLP